MSNVHKSLCITSCIHKKSRSSINKKSETCGSIPQRRIFVNVMNLSQEIEHSGLFSSFESEAARRYNSAIIMSESLDRARHAIFMNIKSCGRWRQTGANTIIQLVHAYGVKDDTAAHAIALLDRFLAANLANPQDHGAGFDEAHLAWNKPECYAIACFLLTTKFRDISAPCIRDMVRIVRPPFPEEEIRRCEVHVLTSVDWALHSATGNFPASTHQLCTFRFRHLIPNHPFHSSDRKSVV